MPLTNRQYDAIRREYDAIQSRNRRLQDQRLLEVYDAIPGYRDIDMEFSSLAARRARAAVFGGKDSDGLLSRSKLLSAQKTELLSSHGFSPDYLQPAYECPDCRDTGYVGSQKCRCLTERIRHYLYSQSNLQDIITAENFDTLSLDLHTGEDLLHYRKAVDAAHFFVDCIGTTYKNMVLTGNVGTGKSFLSNCIAKAVMDKGYFVLYYSSEDLIDALTKARRWDAEEDDEITTSSDFLDCDLLIIDDLGTEHVSSFSITRLFSCLNGRHLKQHSTLISTNLGLRELRSTYSDRIFSRISSEYDILKITGPDLRMQKNL